MKAYHWLPILALVVLLSGCGDGRPFDAKYNSPTQVVITYQGRQYVLNQYGPPVQTPFRYQFEDDGDLDLIVEGQEYEVDSPYDIDKKKKKKKKKPKKTTKKKTTSKSSKSSSKNKK